MLLPPLPPLRMPIRLKDLLLASSRQDCRRSFRPLSSPIALNYCNSGRVPFVCFWETALQPCCAVLCWTWRSRWQQRGTPSRPCVHRPSSITSCFYPCIQRRVYSRTVDTSLVLPDVANWPCMFFCRAPSQAQAQQWSVYWQRRRSEAAQHFVRPSCLVQAASAQADDAPSRRMLRRLPAA
jgi:hypothetical protein